MHQSNLSEWISINRIKVTGYLANEYYTINVIINKICIWQSDHNNSRLKDRSYLMKFNRLVVIRNYVTVFGSVKGDLFLYKLVYIYISLYQIHLSVRLRDATCMKMYAILQGFKSSSRNKTTNLNRTCILTVIFSFVLFSAMIVNFEISGIMKEKK